MALLPPGSEQLQVAPGLVIQNHKLGDGIDCQRRKLGCGRLIGVSQVMDDAAGGPYRQGQVGAAKRFQRQDSVVIQQRILSQAVVESSGLQLGEIVDVPGTSQYVWQ